MGYQALTTTEFERLRTALQAGEAVASGYKPGDIFLGAWPEADKLGYEPGSLERSIFTTAYLAALPRPIESTWEGVLTKVGKVAA